MHTESVMLMSAGATFFLGVMGYMNIVLKARKGLTYYDHPRTFFRLFVLAILTILATFGHHISEYLTVQAVLLMALAGACYVWFAAWWHERCPPGDYRDCFGVPATHEDMCRMNVGYGAVKTLEIVFQQLCALVVIHGLFMFESSALVVSVSFATVVGLAHLPGIHWFGRLFGWFFTLSSTFLALVYPFLIVSDFGGVGVMVLLHVLTYILWYRYLFGQLQDEVYEKARD